LQDGQNLFNPSAPYGDWAIDQSMAKLAQEGFQDIIIIAIDHGEKERIVEYLPYYHPRFGEGKGKFYIQFMKEKLIPYINNNYRTLTDFENTGIGGSSMGGLISLYAGLSNPGVFGKMMIFSPSLWISKKIFEQTQSFAPLERSKIYLYSGGQESQEHLPNTTKLEKLIKEKMIDGHNIDFHFSINHLGNHSEEHWSKEFPEAIKWLYHNTMTLKYNDSIHNDRDIILPCRKDDYDYINTFIPIDKPDFDGTLGSYQLIYDSTGRRIYLLGIGTEEESSQIETAFRKLHVETSKYWKGAIQIYADNLSNEEIIKSAIGFEMATYQIGQYKAENHNPPAASIIYFSKNDLSQLIQKGHKIGTTINRIKGLVDAPPNIKTPEYLGNWALSSAKTNGIKCTILEQNELREQKFDAVNAVGQGSVHPPIVLALEHKPNPHSSYDIALVGKGITFDSGGLSIKGSQNLHYMKSDMGGAAVVLGIMELAAQLNLPINIVGVVAAAENAVGSNSYRPGDVINSFSGKTIEVIDTDAEGRLVLADAINYTIKKFNPNQIINIATLTGSVVRTLAYSAAGMFTNNKEMASQMSEAGDIVHERVWQLPLYNDFKNDLHSDIADIRNFSGKPLAGAITAAKFIEAFTENHKKWMHLDIAGVAFGDSPYTKMKSASGFGIQLILQYLNNISNK